MLHLATYMDDRQWTDYANYLWALWHCRNDQTYSGKSPTLDLYRSYFNHIRWELRVGATRWLCGMSNRLRDLGPTTSPQTEFLCQVDGSWSHGWNGGIGIVIMKQDELVVYRSMVVHACCALHYETLTLREALCMVHQLQITSCTFYTDCVSIANLCSDPCPHLQSDWMAFA